MPETARENAYKDSAWKSETGEPGFLHISAPCIYASVLENLDLRKGMSFLNIGSGTGYLSAMVGFILGKTGTNHGVELYENIVEFAIERIVEMQNSKEASAFEWCIPTFFVGNAFQIKTENLYDRIYCGALVPESHRAYFCSFLKIGGVLIMPYGHALHRIVRKSDREFSTRDVSAVTFSHLIPVNPENLLTNKPVQLPLVEFLSLQSICRNIIRQIIRSDVLQTHNIEMRIIITNKQSRSRSLNNADENNDLPSEPDEDAVHPPRERVRPRLFPRLMNNRVVIIEGERQQRERENNPNPLLNRPQIMPVRQLLAFFARDRIHQHHAARARQAAEQVHVPESSDSEEDDDTVEPQREAPLPQLYSGPDDNTFGYQFISDQEIGDANDDENIAIHPIFDEDHSDTDHEQREFEDGSNQSVQTTDFDERMDPNDATHLENNLEEKSSSQLINPQNDQPKDLVNENSDHRTFSSNSSSVSYETANSDDIPVPEQDTSNDGSGHTNRAFNSAKRQRTIMSESEQQSINIKRKCPNGMGSDGIDELSTKSVDGSHENFGESSSECHVDIEIESTDSLSKNAATDDLNVSFDGCSTSTRLSTLKSNVSGIKQEKNEKEITSEHQANLFKTFHEEFIKRINNLPVTTQVRKFLKYEF